MVTILITLKSARTMKQRQLGQVVITNDDTGDAKVGNYRITATRDGKTFYDGRIEGFPRRSRSVLELLRRGLNDLHEKGKCP